MNGPDVNSAADGKLSSVQRWTTAGSSSCVSGCTEVVSSLGPEQGEEEEEEDYEEADREEFEEEMEAVIQEEFPEEEEGEEEEEMEVEAEERLETEIGERFETDESNLQRMLVWEKPLIIHFLKIPPNKSRGGLAV